MTAKTATKTIEAFTVDAQKTMSDQVEKATKQLETFAGFGQETIDAMLKSQNVAAKAAEEMQAEIIAFSKKTVEEGVAHAKAVAGAQTVTDLIEKQATFTKTALDSYVRETTRLNEMMLAAAKEAFAPLSARAEAAAELMKSHKIA